VPWPLDRAVAPAALAVLDAAGRSVAGAWTVGDDERELSFQPLAPWQAEGHRLVAAPHLEDPSGNRPGRAFERAAESAATADAPVELPFLPQATMPTR
jgi:hypothetical protein